MLDPKFLRENIDLVVERVSLRGEEIDVSAFRELDEKRRALLVKVEALKHERNSVSEEIARIKKEKGDAGELIEKMKGVSNEIKALDDELGGIDEELKNVLILMMWIML